MNVKRMHAKNPEWAYHVDQILPTNSILSSFTCKLPYKMSCTCTFVVMK